MPAGSDTIGSLQVAADNNLASLELDFDGDGTVDSTVSPGIAFDPQQSMSVFKDFIRTLGLNSGVEKSFSAKIDAAIASYSSGKLDAAKGKLNALSNEIKALSGKL